MNNTDVMIPRKKSRKDILVNDGDRLSNLPDDVISHILSSLPTADAVATCVLSKYWMYKWTSISSVDIDDKKLNQLGKSGVAMFLNFMEKILLRRQNARRIRLKLLYKYDSRLVKSWISALLRNKMEILHIDIQGGLVIHSSILNGSSLRELVLVSVCFRVPASNCFHHLTNLCLEKVEIRNKNSNTDTMLFTFPVLEIFKLLNCTWSHVKFVDICAPALNTFMSETTVNVEVNRYKINILAAGLANFRVKGGELANLSLSGETGSKVVYATLQNTVDLTKGPLQRSGLRVQIILKAFSSTLEELTLSLLVARAVLESKRFPLLRFDKLQRLVLCSSERVIPSKTEAVLELLHATPFLKFLVIDVLHWDDYNYGVVKSVPSCISCSLEEIEFVNITGTRNSSRLAKFLVKHAKKLKKIYVHSFDEETKFQIVRDIVSDYFYRFYQLKNCWSLLRKF